MKQATPHPGVPHDRHPQKNLGGKADNATFADIHLVERVYRHIETWLAAAGTRAQVIIVDNTPPDVFADGVVVRYTRDPNPPPFRLIENEVGSHRDGSADTDGSGSDVPSTDQNGQAATDS